MDKSHRAMPLFLGLLAALAGLGYLTFARNGATLPWVDDDEQAVRLEREQQKYDAPNDKIDRLAYLMRSVPSGASGQSPANTTEADDLRQQQMSAQAEARHAQVKLDLDKQFERQPADASWSLESVRAIERSLAADSLKETGTPPPAASRIDCRSSMCRIHLVYGDSGGASDAGMMVNASIAEHMPYTQALSQARSDGGVDYFIYATRDAPTVR